MGASSMFFRRDYGGIGDGVKGIYQFSVPLVLGWNWSRWAVFEATRMPLFVLNEMNRGPASLWPWRSFLFIMFHNGMLRRQCS